MTSPITGKKEIVWHPPTPPTIGERGEDIHPAYALIHASRTTSTPGVVLFDSDIQHGHYVTITLETASRARDLSHDWIHGEKQLFEVSLSEAQWASFVSSMNTSGVPCTLRRVPDNVNVDGLQFEPRLAVSMRETHEAADRAFETSREAMSAYEETLKTGTAKERREALRTLHFALENSTAKNVVQKARADVEAMVYQKALQLGISPSEIGTLELGTSEPQQAIEGTV